MKEAKSGNAKPQPSPTTPSTTLATKREVLPGTEATCTADMKGKLDSLRMDISAPVSVHRKVDSPNIQPHAPSEAPFPPVQSDAQSDKATPPTMMLDETFTLTFTNYQDKHNLKIDASSTVQPSVPSKGDLPAAPSTPPSTDLLNVSAASYLDF
jgi:hypothetical protein